MLEVDSLSLPYPLWQRQEYTGISRLATEAGSLIVMLLLKRFRFEGMSRGSSDADPVDWCEMIQDSAPHAIVLRDKCTVKQVKKVSIIMLIQKSNRTR